MRVAPDQFTIETCNHVGNREMACFVSHLRIKDDLQQQVAQFLAEISPVTPLDRIGSPADVVAAVRFLLAGTDYATGTILVIDGGRLIR